MSRFNNPKALPALLTHPGVPARSVATDSRHIAENEVFRPAAPGSSRTFAIAEAKQNIAQLFCFFVVNAYLLSACANDLIFHFTRGKIHISAVCVLLLPLLFLGTGAFFRGLKTPTGIWFAAFAAWLLLAAPFSVWRGGSANMLVNYLPRAFLICFYLAACVVTLGQVRTVVRVMGIGALFVILSCYGFGGWIDGRFAIPDSLFFSNANELALQLLLGIIVLMYPFFETGKLAKFVSVAAIFVSLSFLLKTGSRGVLIATLATGFLVFLMSGRRRLAVIVVAVPALVIGFALAPTEIRHRILLMGSNAEIINDMDASAIGSRFQREKLLRTSIVLAITHPLFGVGPGQFAVKVAGDQEKKGEHADWLGTHNSYTQVASEAGLPAFIFYVATIVTCMLMDYRIYRRSKNRPGLESIAGISFCMFLSTFAYSIAIFFFHEAYSLHLPLMAGVSISLYLIVKPALDRYQEAAV